MVTAKHVADEIIGRAAVAPPEKRAMMLRAGARAFADLASRATSRQEAEKLSVIGLEFAGAAMHEATVSDFTQLLRSTQEAVHRLGPEGSARASMDAAALQRLASDEDDPRLAETMTSIQPASFSNRDATLGRSAKIKFGPTAADIAAGITQSQTVAFWQGAKRESQAMTVDVGIVLPPVPISSFDVQAFPPGFVFVDGPTYAQIQYGADGFTTNSVVIDVGLGRRVTVVGNFISVLVGMDPVRPPAGQATFTGATLTVGASIGTFAAQSLAPVIRTVRVGAANAGAITGPFPLPQRAVRMLPPTIGNTLNTWTDTLSITFFNVSAAITGFWQGTYAGSATPQFTPYVVPYDSLFFSVTSLNGIADKGPIRIPFELSM